MSETIIETRDLSLKFGRKTALERISVAFRPGEMVLIAGKNGAGKSTFLRCLARVLEPDKGKIIQAPELRRSDIGFISDSLSLFEV